MAARTATMSPASPVLDNSVVDSFLEVLPEACVAIDGNGRVVATNRVWRELPRRVEAQRAANDPVGLDYLKLFRDSMAEQGAENAIAGIKSVLDGLTDQFEHDYIRTTSRSIRWFRMTVRPWRQMGAAAIIFHRDISAEKLTQLSTRSPDLEFQALADSSPVLIWMDSPEEGCTFLNRQWLEFTGVPVQEQLGAGWLELIHPEDRSRLMDAYYAALDQKGDFHAEYRLRHRDGEYRWMKEHGSPRLDANNNLVGYIGTAWDISEQKRTADEAFRATRYARLVREVAEVANSATTLREALQRTVEVMSVVVGFPGGHAFLIEDDEPETAKPANIVYIKDLERFKGASERAAPMTWPGVKDIPAQVLKEGKLSIRDIREDCLTPERYPRSVVALEFGLRTLIQLPIVVDDRVEAILEFASDEELAGEREFAEALSSAAERIARFFERRRAQILFVKNRHELETSARLAKLVRDVARVSSTATTMRDALQQSIDVICETLGFPVGHALLIEDDEPNLIKSSHVVHVQDMQRFAELFAVTTELKWPADFGAPGEVLRSGKPVIHDMTISRNDPQLYPRAAPALAAGLRTALHLPVLVDGNVEAIVEFASDEDISEDREIADALMAATERISGFFERRRAQILLLRKKEELEASADRLFTVAGRLVDSQEEERRRIAREIHDDFTQRLALVSMKIGNLTGRDQTSTPEELDASLEEIRKSTAAVASDLRDLSHQLHPAMLGLLGLVRALQAQCEEFERIRGIQTTFESSVSDQDASPQTATCLYRVLQEALMNVAKHSGSKVANVSVNRIGTELVMQIRDEGHGFPGDAAGLKGIGLLNMRERVQFLNGTLTVNSSPGNGAEVLIRVPALPPV